MVPEVGRIESSGAGGYEIDARYDTLDGLTVSLSMHSLRRLRYGL